MADFEQLKNQQRQVSEAAKQAARAKERERSLSVQIAELERSANANNPATLEEIKRLRAKARRAGAERLQATESLQAGKEMLSGFWRELLPLTDPRERIGRWSDKYPILMFPLRLETRFKKVQSRANAGTIDQLWVRIYPDECLVDTFEEDLTEMERKNARRYWAFHWAAVGDETKQRQAWREMVASHGSGRAGWVIKNYLPLNPAEAPMPNPGGDFNLVIPVQDTEPIGADADAVAAFWRNVFLKNELVENASDLAKKYPPSNLGENAPEGANVKVFFVRFPMFGEEDSRPFSWSEAPKVKLLPERFVFLGYGTNHEVPTVVEIGNLVQAPLQVGPNPTAEKAEQFTATADGDLKTPAEMRWMTDFDEALAKGMGFRINLDTVTASRGFDRVLVLGIRLGSDQAEGSQELEELLRHHLYGRSGFAIVPQGTPTNNTEDVKSGYSRADDPDESFPIFVKRKEQFQFTADSTKKTDGQWLAESLGISNSLLQQTPNADQKDRAEAQAMNDTLFPATMGYWMQKMMNPVFNNEQVVGRTRYFFTNYVSGRGALPAVRVGRQPYGILLASAYSKAKWFPSANIRLEAVAQRDSFLPSLHSLLMKLDGFWKKMAKDVQHVGKASDNPQQQLLDIVTLHPASVEYHARYGHSLAYLYNYFLFAGVSFNLWAELAKMFFLIDADQTLTQLGYNGAVRPKIFEKYYRDGQHRLNGPIIDDRPLSETDHVRIYAEGNKNYIEWLADAVSDYEGKLLPQMGLSERPNALLYLLLRHAIIEEYDHVGHRTRLEAKIMEPATYLAAVAREPEFIHVQNAAVSESRFAHLLEPVPQVSGNQDSLSRYIGLEVKKPAPQLAAVHSLKRMKTALEGLKDLPTARLERLLAEHIDCCSYRHDAWIHGLLNVQLSQMRPTVVPQLGEGGEIIGEVPAGVYLGAYGWLENLRPEGKKLTTPTLTDELGNIFQRPNDIPLTSDSTNQGYIHAPSLNHAVTAAVLRNGYLSNATPTQPDLLAVNLSSERVLKALETLEGIRNGQSLGALLGYRFERSLHDRDPAMFVFSYQLRKAFPLVANRLASTSDADTEAQEAIAARNVVDGYALLKKTLGTTNTPNFSFLTTVLTAPAPNATQRNFIEETIKDLLDIHDALSDLGIAESVHQIVQGNYDRAAANLDAYSKATFPQTPDVVITPRTGTTLTHRVAIHLDGQAVANLADNPRSQAEPGVNQWLTSLLPAANEMAVLVIYTNPGDPQPFAVSETVTLQHLGLQPLDLLYLFHFDNQQALGTLDELVFRHLFSMPQVHANATIEIRYTESVVAGGIKASFFELAPLLQSLRHLVTASRPLRSTDAAPPTEASANAEPPLVLDKNRIVAALPNLAILTGLEADLANNALDIDQKLGAFTAAFSKIGLYGIPEAGFGFVYYWRQEQYTMLVKKISERVDAWGKKLTDFIDLLDNQLPLAATEADKTEVLRKAEALVSTEFITPLPAIFATYQADVEQKGLDFSNKKNSLEGLAKNPPATWQQFLDDLSAELPIETFDAEAFVLTDELDEADRFIEKLTEKTATLKLGLQTRITEVNQKITVHDDPSTVPAKKAEALQEAGKILFGEDFMMVPHFDLSNSQGVEWQNALDAQPDILAFQNTEKNDAFPVDTWFYGTARVREKMSYLENTQMLSEAFGKTPQELQAVQFPFRQWEPDPMGAPGVKEPEPWLALEYPSTFKIDEEKVLYTAIYATPFNRIVPQCGLLLDEWTEVVPLKEETTGLTFHYDRPNSEPPQAWLLAMATTFGSEWSWEDLVQALHETLDLAKQRAVEPAQVEETTLGVFSPASVFPVTPWAIHPSLNLSLVNLQKVSA